MAKAIILMGPRSVGKTTVGKILAKKLNAPFYNLDEIVERKTGNILKYIKKNGYDAIRIEERKILLKFLDSMPEKSVLSIGGGTIASQLKKISELNCNDLKKKGYLIYLFPFKSKKESIRLLYGRECKRYGDQSLAEIKKLYDLRAPVYEKMCDYKILIGNKKPIQIAQQILHLLKRD